MQRQRLRVSPDLIDDLDELHGGERLPRSALDGSQDLLFPLVPVADVVLDLGAGIQNHGAMTCEEHQNSYVCPYPVHRLESELFSRRLLENENGDFFLMMDNIYTRLKKHF